MGSQASNFYNNGLRQAGVRRGRGRGAATLWAAGDRGEAAAAQVQAPIEIGLGTNLIELKPTWCG